MPDGVHLAFFTRAPLGTPSGLAALLDAFELLPPCAPTHWGTEPRGQAAYDRQAILATCGGAAVRFGCTSLSRRKPLRYQAEIETTTVGVDDVQIDFGAVTPRERARPFALADAVASRIEPLFGFVHPFWKGMGERGQTYYVAGTISGTRGRKGRTFQEAGPRSLAARTWLGSHVTALVGRDRLVAAGCLVRETAWDGVVVDLVERPDEASFEELSSRLAEVMGALSASGVFGDFANPIWPRPGPRWVPIPNDRPEQRPPAPAPRPPEPPPIDGDAVLAAIRSTDRDARLRAYAEVHRCKNDDPRAMALVPELVRALAIEKIAKTRNAVAALVVRFAPAAVDAPGLVEQLGAQLGGAKTRAERFAALVCARLAVEKGWDATPIVPVVGKYLFEGGQPADALHILTLAAARGVDVLSPVALDGFEIWEAVMHLLESPTFAMRRGAIRLLTAAARQRLPHLSYYVGAVEGIVADPGRNALLLDDARECLVALREALEGGS